VVSIRRDMYRVYVPEHAVAFLDVSDTLTDLVDFAGHVSAEHHGVCLEKSACCGQLQYH
jgi:hypothetical protein